ncbi:DUF3556 domain-containing protein [Mycobacterium uberis]|nr:DUF3556 domain-containing protein [Mycobacterium uberis]
MYNEQLLAALQRRCNFDKGDICIIIFRGQAIHIQK